MFSNVRKVFFIHDILKVRSYVVTRWQKKNLGGIDAVLVRGR